MPISLSYNGTQTEWATRLYELGIFMEKHKVKVAVVQESKLSQTSSTPCIQNYTTVRKDRRLGQGGSLLTFVDKSLNYSRKPESPETLGDPHLEELSEFLKSNSLLTRQLGPRYEGQLTWMAEPICHSFRSLVRPHDYHHSGLRTDEQGRTERVLQRGRCLRTILSAVCCDGGGVRRGQRTTISFSPQHELPPARLVIHRQTSAQNNVGDAGKFRRGRAY